MLSTLKSRDPDAEKSQGVAMWIIGSHLLTDFDHWTSIIQPKERAAIFFACMLFYSMVTWCLTVGIKAVSKGLWKPVRTSRARWDNLVFQLMPVWQTEFKHIERNCTKFSERFLIATWSDLTKDFLKQCLQRRAAEEKWARIAHAKASLRWPILWINFCLSSFNLDPHRLRFRIFQVLFRTPQASLTAWLELCPTFRRRIDIETWSDWVGLQRGGTNDLLETLLGWV